MLPSDNSISEMTDCNPFLVIVSAAFLAFINPHPVTASGPFTPMSSAVWSAKPFKVEALIKPPNISL